MTTEATTAPFTTVLRDSHAEILAEWIAQQLADGSRSKSVSDASLKNSSTEFLKLLEAASAGGNGTDIDSGSYGPVKQMLSDLSASRAVQGSTPTETASFILSLKTVLFKKLAAHSGSANITGSMLAMSELMDKLGLYTAEAFQKSREGIIRRQQKEMMEMSTPVIKLWDGVLAVPLIGTLDSARTQIVMENLLQKIVETGSKIAILDITGVPTVDTQTAQHLMKTVSATRLMGADCIISGIRPQIAQTIVHLGIDIYDITTKATMADAVKDAMAKTGWVIKQIRVDDDRAERAERAERADKAATQW
jgi:rsbT co-antagonist protein RsbR